MQHTARPQVPHHSFRDAVHIDIPLALNWSNGPKPLPNGFQWGTLCYREAEREAGREGQEYATLCKLDVQYLFAFTAGAALARDYKQTLTLSTEKLSTKHKCLVPQIRRNLVGQLSLRMKRLKEKEELCSEFTTIQTLWTGCIQEDNLVEWSLHSMTGPVKSRDTDGILNMVLKIVLCLVLIL